jgi:hypothetical protein
MPWAKVARLVVTPGALLVILVLTTPVLEERLHGAVVTLAVEDGRRCMRA